MTYSRAALLILDGWGHGPNPEVSAIAQANTPFMDGLYAAYPHSTLTTFGEAVGLPEGQMGNSEVGHLNIGAGRVVYQELVRINRAITDGSLAENATLLEAFRRAKTTGRKVHFLGLVSDGGVHAHWKHLAALCALAAAEGCEDVYIHAFTDGRDTDPKSGVGHLEQLMNEVGDGAKLASICGRYYAMDRDKRWERIKLAYDALVAGKGAWVNAPLEAMAARYAAGETDEFLKPMCVEGQYAPIEEGDVVLFFNFRTDRCRQIVTALSQRAFEQENMQPIAAHFYTMTRYDEQFKDVAVLFEKENLKDTLGEVLERAGKKQLRIAETEKYPHVTFFFSGGEEQAFGHEGRRIVASPAVATYDLQPEMSAQGITDEARQYVAESQPDFICLNYANTDMVGHTGVFSAAVKAAETVDACLSRLVPYLLEQSYALLIIADHGNADVMQHPDGSPHTAHTLSPVPCILVTPDNAAHTLQDGKLADVAPTILHLLGLTPPAAMTGEKLYK